MAEKSGRNFSQILKDTHVTKGADLKPKHVRWQVKGKVATLTLDRPERKNPITFESYAEMRDLFRALCYVEDVKVVVVTGAGGNFCSGGDVHDIIGPLLKLDMTGLLNFTRMTGDLIKAIRDCPQTIIAAMDGVCAGAGACVAMASDIRLGTPNATVAFLFNRVGLAGCDMGACAMLPRIIGQGRASELLFTGRALKADEGERWGFFNRLVDPAKLQEEAATLAGRIADGPTFGNAMTKKMMDREWNMGVAEFIEAEAQAQAICMQTRDFERAFNAFVKKERPVFEGN
ncbi:MAG: enoyl-CoA hydratase family protein [Alphaproteobacteria bacterium]